MNPSESTPSILDASAAEAATAEEDSSPSITSSESPQQHEYEQICYEKL